eukprot:g37523.t1
MIEMYKSMRDLAETGRNFSFNSSYFLQTKGVAMGIHVGPSYACLFVGYMEQSLCCCYTGTMPHLFLRYIDDCIGAASCSHEELEQFINFTNTFHPDLTRTIPDTSLSFLDLSVSISGNQLSTDIYFKPTDSHSYLDYTSTHPPSCKNAISYSQFLCLCSICSQDEAFHSRTSQMSFYFNDCNFPSPGFTCTSTKVVYCIRCSRCGLVYIGEIKHRVGGVVDNEEGYLRVQRDLDQMGQWAKEEQMDLDK